MSEQNRLSIISNRQISASTYHNDFILSALSAGCCYLPMNVTCPAYPTLRKKFVTPLHLEPATITLISDCD